MTTSPDASPARPSPTVVLGSGSRYRRELLGRLLTGFAVDSPDIDESALAGESPAGLAERLAIAKARAVAARHPGAVVIGSDQVAACGDITLGKPGTTDRALAQLEACNGRELVLHTAVCVLGPGPDLVSRHRDETRLQFRTSTRDELARYVAREQPLDCAGSFRIEGLGIALFAGIETRDPTAIQGLPLLWLAACLPRHGVVVI